MKRNGRNMTWTTAEITVTWSKCVIIINDTPTTYTVHTHPLLLSHSSPPAHFRLSFEKRSYRSTIPWAITFFLLLLLLLLLLPTLFGYSILLNFDIIYEVLSVITNWSVDFWWIQYYLCTHVAITPSTSWWEHFRTVHTYCLLQVLRCVHSL